MVDEDAGDASDTETEFDAAEAAAEFAAAMAATPAGGDAEGGNYTAILEDEVEALGRALAENDTALQAARDEAVTASAEVDRVRARIEREAARTIVRARSTVLVSFLEVADDLDRAVAELRSQEVAPAVAQGVQLVRSKLHTVLTQHGARHRPSLGLAFDPAHHEAVGVVPATEAVPAGSIVEVLREGYELDEQTLRIAQVVVAKG